MAANGAERSEAERDGSSASTRDVPLSGAERREGVASDSSRSVAAVTSLEAYHSMIKQGKQGLVEECLMEHPEYLDLPDKSGRTSLYYAAMFGEVPIIELLLRKGSCALDIPDARGLTPLHQALKSIGNWIGIHDKSAIETLKALGASVIKEEYLFHAQITRLKKSVPEEEIVEVRWRIYFSRSLVVRLLFT